MKVCQSESEWRPHCKIHDWYKENKEECEVKTLISLISKRKWNNYQSYFLQNKDGIKETSFPIFCYYIMKHSSQKKTCLSCFRLDNDYYHTCSAKENKSNNCKYQPSKSKIIVTFRIWGSMRRRMCFMVIKSVNSRPSCW